jgi:hypothetical protein
MEEIIDATTTSDIYADDSTSADRSDTNHSDPCDLRSGGRTNQARSVTEANRDMGRNDDDRNVIQTRSSLGSTQPELPPGPSGSELWTRLDTILDTTYFRRNYNLRRFLAQNLQELREKKAVYHGETTIAGPIVFTYGGYREFTLTCEYIAAQKPRNQWEWEESTGMITSSLGILLPDILPARIIAEESEIEEEEEEILPAPIPATKKPSHLKNWWEFGTNTKKLADGVTKVTHALESWALMIRYAFGLLRRPCQIGMLITLAATVLTAFWMVLPRFVAWLKTKRSKDESLKEASIITACVTIVANTFACITGFCSADNVHQYVVGIIKKCKNPVVIVRIITSIGVLAYLKGKVSSQKLNTQWMVMKHSFKSAEKFDASVLDEELTEMMEPFDMDLKTYVVHTYPYCYNNQTDLIELEKATEIEGFLQDEIIKNTMYEEEGKMYINPEYYEGPVYGKPRCGLLANMWYDLDPELRFFIIVACITTVFYALIYLFATKTHNSQCKVATHQRSSSCGSHCALCDAKSRKVDCGYHKCGFSKRPYLLVMTKSGNRIEKKGDNESLGALHRMEEAEMFEWWENQRQGRLTREEEKRIVWADEMDRRMTRAGNQSVGGETIAVEAAVVPPAPARATGTTPARGANWERNRKQKVRKAKKRAKRREGTAQAVGTPSQAPEESMVATDVAIVPVATPTEPNNTPSIVDPEEINEAIMQGVNGNIIPIPTASLRRRVSVIGQKGDRKGKHVGAGYPYRNVIVTVAHTGRQWFTSMEIGHKVLLYMREPDQLGIGTIMAYDEDLDIMIISRPTVEIDSGKPLSFKSLKHTRKTPEVGDRFTINYEDAEKEVSCSGRILKEDDCFGLHDCSTDNGASGEPLFGHMPGAPVLGMHKGKAVGKNRYIPISVINSFLANTTQSLSPVSGPEL